MAKPTIVQVQFIIKMGREQIEFAAKETERLYKLIEAGSTSAEWAIKRIEQIQAMILSPDSTQAAAEIRGKLRSIDESILATNGSTVSDAS